MSSPYPPGHDPFDGVGRYDRDDDGWGDGHAHRDHGHRAYDADPATATA